MKYYIQIIVLTLALNCQAQFIKSNISTRATGLSPVSAPTWISTTNTSSLLGTTSPITTANISVQSGDILVGIAYSEDQGFDVTISDNSSLTWTLQQNPATSGFSIVKIWTAPVSSTSSTLTVTFTLGTAGGEFGGSVVVIRGSSGVGATAGSTIAAGVPQQAITTTQVNSLVVFASANRNASQYQLDAWNTINSITPTVGGSGEIAAARDGVHYTLASAYWSNVGAAGSKTVGKNVTSSKYTVAAVEIKGQ